MTFTQEKLASIAVPWWETERHPYAREDSFACDAFALFLCRAIGIQILACAGDDESEERFAEMVGWSRVEKEVSNVES